MLSIGIDAGKFKHCACVINDGTGVTLKDPFFFDNNKEGFDLFLSTIKPYTRRKYCIGMKDTSHYGNNLVMFLLDQDLSVVLVNPRATSLRRRELGWNAKNDKKDSILIAEMLSDIKVWRTVTRRTYKLQKLKEITRLYHQRKEQQNQDQNRLQRALDIGFPEVNTLSWTRYSKSYMSTFEQYPSAARIAKAGIRTLRKVLQGTAHGRSCTLTAEDLKAAARISIIDKDKTAVKLEVTTMINIIRTKAEQIKLLEKEMEESAAQLNSPITSWESVISPEC